MEGEQRERLNQIMSRLAAGDDAAVVALHHQFGPTIRSVLASIAQQRGTRLTPPELDDLVFDACFALRRLARGWRPDGALPWTWARHRLVNLVDRRMRPSGQPFDEELEPPATPETWNHPDPPLGEVLGSLAGAHPTVALLAEAFEQALTPGERDVLLRYALQRSAGDPAPSQTVAAELGLGPPAVRQRASRARRKLADLARRDPRYTGLAELAIVTDRHRGCAA